MSDRHTIMHVCPLIVFTYLEEERHERSDVSSLVSYEYKSQANVRALRKFSMVGLYWIPKKYFFSCSPFSVLRQI